MTLNQQKVLDATFQCFVIAHRLYPHYELHANVLFDLNGRAAGMACYRDRLIRYNHWMIENNCDEFIRDTVPHEVAHIVLRQIGIRGVRSHGYEWRKICLELGGTGARCHEFELNPNRQRKQTRQHLYKCPCREHWITTTKHNRVQQFRRNYICVHCRQEIHSVGLARMKAS